MEEEQKTRIFLKKKREEIRNPLIQSFLEDKDNLLLLEKSILEPTEFNKAKVDEAFRRHYEEIRKIKYVSNLIYFYSIDYDKKSRKQKERNLLILDKGNSDEDSTPIIDYIEDKSVNMNIPSDMLLEIVEDEKLLNALRTLTSKQLEILDMIYSKELSLKEIAKILRTTPQNISNHHRKSLKKLNDILNKEALI